MRQLIKGGRVIDPSQGLDERREVLLDQGRVEALLKPGSKAEDAKVIEAAGLWVVPGLIDLHVHLREPGEEYKETIATGAAAAIAGGFTAVAGMANTKPVNDTAAVTDYILMKAAEAKKARVWPVAAVTRGQQGEGLAELWELKDHGCVAFSDDGHPIQNAEVMRRALEYCRPLDLPILSHPEHRELSEGGVMHEGFVSTELGLAGIPAAAEEVMVARDILLAEATGGRLHLQHLSTAGSVRLVRSAKARGLKITAETCPHYFTLTHEAVRGYDTNFKMNPPLRSEEDRQAVIAGLADGTIDAIASDHAPHSSVEKDVEFDQAANGIVGLETTLPLSLKLVHDKIISPLRLIELLSTNPAKILGVRLPGVRLPPGAPISGHGTLQPGALADLTILDPEETWTVNRDRFFSKGKNTPFHGHQVKGQAKTVMIEGKVVKP